MRRYFEKLRSEKIRNRAIRVSIALALTIFLHQFAFEAMENLGYDMRIRFKSNSPVSGHVQTIAIDQMTVRELRRSPNARDHIQFLKVLAKEQPRAIVYLIHPKELVGSYDELQEFADIAAGLNNLYVVSEKLNLSGEAGRLEMLPPFSAIKVAIGPKLNDGSGVVRRMLMSFEGRPAIHPLLSAQINGIYTDVGVRGVIKSGDQNEALIDFHPSGTYRSLSFSDILEGKISQGQVTNKIIIVGRDTEGSNKDYVQTPYSREQMGMTLLELHANMFDTAIQNRAVIPLPAWLNFLVTYLISILIVYVVLALKPVYGLGILVGAIAAFVVLSLLSFAIFNIAVGVAHPLLAAFMCYYFLIPYRLIVENRRSWEYYQRNKILSQVEELKSNFLSMMSHDIKTPLARIQGMVDVIKRDAQPLGDQQTRALDSINQSANDLTHFISSLLDVGRVESQGINLHKSSKDINSLLGEVVEKLEYLAKEKNVQIVTEFEPMFSVKLDVELMKQVFSNLIENAIKYSKPESKILVTTDEVEGNIIVQISDQGYGISEDDLSNIFMKFYRSKEAKTSKIKGTGVGLYLAKYFVELHNGKIEVESKMNQGSTFTVNLPMDL
ncbi:MAG: hypothetical protein A4S09_11855 [Proteobacteria bacterium SG_bin7]|nr:MAG: hypothetical protein A4S09_11855 [Proteobacteria bacterium SG_bin7]